MFWRGRFTEMSILSGPEAGYVDQAHWLNKPHAKQVRLSTNFALPVPGGQILLWKPLKDLILLVQEAGEEAALGQSELWDLLEISNIPFWTQTTPTPWGFAEVGHQSTELRPRTSTWTPVPGARLCCKYPRTWCSAHPWPGSLWTWSLGMCRAYFISLRVTLKHGVRKASCTMI